MPRSGAEYVYFQEAFGSLHKFWGPLPSFLCSWVYVVVLRPAEVAVIIMAFAQYVCQPFEVYIVDIEAESQDLAKKYIAILALGKCLGFSQSVYNGYRVSFQGVKWPWRGVNHPPLSSAEVKERVQLYLYSALVLLGLF